MSTISIIGTGGMAAAIGGLAAKAGHTVEVMSRDDRNVRRRPGRGHCHPGGSLLRRS
jgi:predicted dinucleotide-binding enzyme